MMNNFQIYKYSFVFLLSVFIWTPTLQQPSKGILMYKLTPTGFEEMELPKDQISVKKEIIPGDNNENYYQYQLFYIPQETITIVVRAKDIGGKDQVIHDQDGVRTFHKENEYLLGQINSLEDVEGDKFTLNELEASVINDEKQLGGVNMFFPIFKTTSILYKDYIFSSVLTNKKIIHLIKVVDTPYKFFLQKYLLEQGTLNGGGGGGEQPTNLEPEEDHGNGKLIYFNL